jgi:hypothetical protein
LLFWNFLACDKDFTIFSIMLKRKTGKTLNPRSARHTRTCTHPTSRDAAFRGPLLNHPHVSQREERDNQREEQNRRRRIAGSSPFWPEEATLAVVEGRGSTPEPRCSCGWPWFA